LLAIWRRGKRDRGQQIFSCGSTIEIKLL